VILCNILRGSGYFIFLLIAIMTSVQLYLYLKGHRGSLCVITEVAPCGACGPWIFFINGVLCFLNINGSEMEKKKDDWRLHFKEKMSQEQAHHHRKPWIRA